MKFIIVGVWAVIVTLGAGYGMALTKLDAPVEDGPRLEGLRYTSLPTLSVPVLEEGRVAGYVVVRIIYTADAGVLRSLAAPPDPFLSDEVFRILYSSAKTRFGNLQRIDIEDLGDTVRNNVNARMGADVVQDLLVDGLNYVDLSDPSSAAAAQALADGVATPARAANASGTATPSSAKPQSQ